MTESESTDYIELFLHWFRKQRLRGVPIPGYEPTSFQATLDMTGHLLTSNDQIADGKVRAALAAIRVDPYIPRTETTDVFLGGNAGYMLQVFWPLTSIFTGYMPLKVARTTATSYIGWLHRIFKAVHLEMSTVDRRSLEVVTQLVSEAYAQAAGSPSPDEARAARQVEGATTQVDTSDPGIYVFTTPTYLAYPPFGWNPNDASRQDFRYLKTGSTTVDIDGRIQSEIRRQTGLPEPYIIVARFKHPSEAFHYAGAEQTIHHLLAEARHGPEDDGTRREARRNAGTEWFITRLPLIHAIARSLDLELSVDDAFQERLNELFEECDLPNWVLS